MNNIQIVIADDHHILRENPCWLLANQSTIDLIARTSSVEETLKLLREHHPDILLLDISKPGINRLELIKLGQVVSPGTRTVVLSCHQNQVFIYKALEAGALGYVIKGSPSRELIAAIQYAHQNKYYLCSQIQKEVIHSFVTNHKPEEFLPKNGYEQLTNREKQIFFLLVEGHSDAEIANMLCVSFKTVHKHRASISRKICIDSPVIILQYAISCGLVNPDTWH